jgi:FkbM family methyltransferase
VVAVEPDELNRKILEQKFLEYRFKKKPVVVVGKAVSDSQTVETMWIDAPGSAKNSLSRKWVKALRDDKERFGKGLNFSQKRRVETITLEQLIDAYGQPFFIKIDVEGYEVNVLRGLQRPVPFVSFEVNLPQFRPEGLECIELLERVAAQGRFNFTADCRKGLAMQRWLEKSEFEEILRNCDKECIEIFWAAVAPLGQDTRSGRAA